MGRIDSDDISAGQRRQARRCAARRDGPGAACGRVGPHRTRPQAQTIGGRGMKRTIGLMAAAVMSLVATGAFAKGGKTAWTAQGKYYETCGCAISCPCATGDFV